MSQERTKFCKHCGQTIDADCIVCPKCGKQVEDLKNNDTPIIINNSASSSASASASAFISTPAIHGKAKKNKWIALFTLYLYFMRAQILRRKNWNGNFISLHCRFIWYWLDR